LCYTNDQGIFKNVQSDITFRIMGVIHKFKFEVIDFIVQSKRDVPSISCRKLAFIASDKFQIRLSKSSVSNILKNAELSSPVGRRSMGGLKTAKFKIPADKKKQLFGDTYGLKSSQTQSVQEARDVPEQSKNKEQSFEITTGIQPSEREAVSFESKILNKNKPTDVVKQPSNEIEAIQIKDTAQQWPIYNGMGISFLKAAEWDISDRSIISEILRKNIKAQIPHESDSIFETLLYFNLFGVDKLDYETNYNNHGIWQLNEIDPSVDPKTILESAHQINVLPSFQLDYLNELKQSLHQVGCFKIALEDGTHMVLDAQLATVWQSQVGSFFKWPVHKALNILSRCLISNIQSPVLYCVSPQSESLKGFCELVASFENYQGKQMKAISVIDSDNNEIASFTIIPNKKRTFVVGIWPWQEEFAELTGVVKWATRKTLEIEGIGQSIYYTETKSDFLNAYLKMELAPMTVLTVWSDQEKDPTVAILSNDRQSPAQQIIKSFVLRWPYWSKNIAANYIQDHSLEPNPDDQGDLLKQIDQEFNEPHKFTELTEIFAHFGNLLHAYCQRKFYAKEFSGFDINDLITICYDLNGQLIKQDNLLLIKLIVPPNSQFIKQLKFAVKRINEGYIFDSQHRRLLMEIVE